MRRDHSTDLCVTKRDVRERRELLVFERESEILRIELSRPSHVLHLIPNAVTSLDECVWCGLGGYVLHHGEPPCLRRLKTFSFTERLRLGRS